MNDPISWDPTLVKKFSSSNHYKLLNQLRNEVKKYPLNNKKKITTFQSKENNLDNKNKSSVSNTQNISFSNNPKQSNESNAIKSTVSFNNAKNFSIYNQSNNNNSLPNESLITDQSKSQEDSFTPTFKERLDQIDMK